MIHAFRHEWQFWLVLVEFGSSRQYKIHEIAKFRSAENFAKYYHTLPSPAEFKVIDRKQTSLAVFRGDIRPAWEDPHNKDGGHHVYEVASGADVTEIWKTLLVMLLSAELTDLCNGIVCGIKRTGATVIEIWMASWTDPRPPAAISEAFGPKVVFKNSARH
jgi:hypothetical protein